MVIFARKGDIQRLYKKHKKLSHTASIEDLRENERKLPSSLFLKLLNYQIERDVLKKKPDSEFVHFCLSCLHILGLAAYRRISKKLKLISESILMHMFDDVQFMPGINRTVNQIIALKFEQASKCDKLCTIIIDELPLKKHVTDNAENVFGYEDDGTRKTAHLAKYATYVIVRGMFADWKLPVQYTLNSKPATATQLKSLLFSALRQMRKIGLIVKVVIGKLRANIYELAERLGISPNRQAFNFEGQDYYFMFDSPQLMNSTRNNLLKSEIRFGQQHASWQHLVKYYHTCQRLGNLLTPLTMAHINPNKDDMLDLNNSIQVLSCPVARHMTIYMEQGLVHRSAMGTIEFISFFGNLFAFMDSRPFEGLDGLCEAYNGSTRQLNFIERSCSFLDTLHVYNGSRNITNEVKFITAWKVNLIGLPKMWADVLKTLEIPERLYRYQRLMLHRLQASGTMFDFMSGSPPFTPIEFKAYYQFCFMSEYMKNQSITELDPERRIKLICEKIPKRNEASTSSGRA